MLKPKEIKQIKANESVYRDNITDLYRYVKARPNLLKFFKRIYDDEYDSGIAKRANKIFKDFSDAIGSSSIASRITAGFANDFSESEMRDEIVGRLYDRVQMWATPEEAERLRETFLVGFIAIIQEVERKWNKFDETAEKQLEKKGEEPANAALGRVAFGEERTDVPYERDKPKEKRLYKDLESHVNDNMKMPKASASLAKDILQNDQYPKIFKKPRRSIVYRGMGVSDSWLRKVLELDKRDDLPKSGTEKITYTYKPKTGESSSWTADKTVAKNFAEEQADGDYSVILYATKEDNENSFLDLRGGLYDIEGFEYQDEDEIIGLGSIETFKISWKSKDY